MCSRRPPRPALIRSIRGNPFGGSFVVEGVVPLTSIVGDVPEVAGDTDAAGQSERAVVQLYSAVEVPVGVYGALPCIGPVSHEFEAAALHDHILREWCATGIARRWPEGCRGQLVDAIVAG